jgi:hypothetical protein
MTATAMTPTVTAATVVLSQSGSRAKHQGSACNRGCPKAEQNLS